MRKRLVLETQSALSISGSPALGNLNRTLDYIPGTVLRGALAGAYYRRHGNRSGDFQRLFCDSAIRYENLYPVAHGTQRGSQPIPITAYTCKRRPGFLGEELSRPFENHGVRDLLLDLTVYQETQNAAAVPDECHHQGTCPAPLDRFTGFCSYRSDVKHYESKRHRAHKRQLGRTEIADSTQAALHGSLHTLEALNEAQQFAGYIHLPDQGLTSLLGSLLSDAPLLLGTGTSKGLGECHKNTFDDANLFVDFPDLAMRLQQFDQEVQTRVAQHGPPCLNVFFALTCYSDVIFRDGFFRYQSALRVDDLQQNLSQANRPLLDGFCLYSIHTRIRPVAGWHAAWRLPKEEALAIAKGSVLVYARSVANDAERQQVLQYIHPALAELETNGIGERRAEGFGVIVVCDPFHYRRNASSSRRQKNDLWL